MGIQSIVASTFSLLTIFTILSIGFISYRISADMIERHTLNYMKELVKQVNGDIDSYISYMENISEVALNNRALWEYFEEEIPGNNQKEEHKKKVTELFDAIINVRKDITSITVFGYNKEFISDSQNKRLNPYAVLEKEQWYIKAKEADGEIIISPTHVQNIIWNRYPWVISLSRELTSLDGKKKYGIFLADLNFKVIRDLCSEVHLGKNGYIFIVNKDGKVIYHPAQQLINSDLLQEEMKTILSIEQGSFVSREGTENKLYEVQTSLYSGWKVVGVANTNELLADKKSIFLYFILMSTAFIILVVLMSFLLSRKISSPIKRMERSMQEVQAGNFDIRVQTSGPREMQGLGKTFNLMNEKIKQLIEEIKQEQELKRESEIKALQAQINPHFLYNTLDSIIWLAEGKKTEEVIETVSALAKLLRYGISKGEECVVISRELEHVTHYLMIQRMRYSDEFEYFIDVDKTILSCKTIKIILQPLVENAIYHGIRSKEDRGIIYIRGKRIKDKILFEVEDDGLGMTEEQLANILSAQPSQKEGSGIGVKNVHERLKRYYGEEYGLVYQSTPDRGTCVSVWLPFVE